MKKFKIKVTRNTEKGHERFILPFVGLIFDQLPKWGWKCLIFGVCWWKWHIGIQIGWETKK